MAPFIALAGFMGSGKSSVGSALADLTGLTFRDLDAEFVRKEGEQIADYFAREGEASFRRREAEVLREILGEAAVSGLVLALGGGTLGDPASRKLLEGRGGVVFLDVSAEEAWRRVRASDRPLARSQEQFHALLADRRPTYEEVSDWVIPVQGRSVEEIATEVADLMALAGGLWQSLWGRRLTSTQGPSLVVGGDGARATLVSRAAAASEAGRRILVITDANVSRAWGREISASLGVDPTDAVLVLQPGEPTKNVENLKRCWDWLAAQGARRDDIVVALGGGVVGDLAGFAAATYHRGLALWQIPTSLLAQVDSSVGGKTAIDLEAGKNLVGAFYQPEMVVTDPRVLRTLPEDEYVAGLGEVVKHALLVSEEVLFGLETKVDEVLARDPATVGDLVRMSVWYKARVVSEDERESGVRAVLNLGHTVGHALEVAYGYGSLKHGEAVSLGLLVALAVSERTLGLDPTVSARTRRLLGRLGLPTVAKLPSVESLLTSVGRDKKQRAGTSGFVGLRAIGDPVWGLNVPSKVLVDALEVIAA